MSLDPERRQAILDAVGRWLDEHPDEPLPAGLDPALAEDRPPPGDLASLAGSVLALRHDVKLQTKVLKRVEEGLGDASQGMAEAQRELGSRAAVAEDTLVELFDRLRRCAQACATAGEGLPRWSGRRRTRELVEGLAAGVELTLQRAGELLVDGGLVAVDPTGEPFDPQRMRAVGRIEAQGSVLPGSVVETVRVGLERHPQSRAERTTVRLAEVIVAREQERT